MTADATADPDKKLPAETATTVTTTAVTDSESGLSDRHISHMVEHLRTRVKGIDLPGGGGNISDGQFDFLKMLDAATAVGVGYGINELLKIIAEPLPEFIRNLDDSTVDEDGNPGSAMPEFIMQCLKLRNDYIKTKTAAIASLFNMSVKRLPGLEQYQPHTFIGGKRYPIPTGEFAWEICDGLLTHTDTLNRCMQKVEAARRALESKAKQTGGQRGGGCLGNDGGACMFLEQKIEPSQSWREGDQPDQPDQPPTTQQFGADTTDPAELPDWMNDANTTDETAVSPPVPPEDA